MDLEPIQFYVLVTVCAPFQSFTTLSLYWFDMFDGFFEEQRLVRVVNVILKEIVAVRSFVSPLSIVCHIDVIININIPPEGRCILRELSD